MRYEAATRSENVISTLRRLARPDAPQERCELCGVSIPPRHRHLLEMPTRGIRCACDPCASRFQAVKGERFKLLPRDTRLLPGFQISDGQWEGLAVPINLVFLFRNTEAGKVVCYYPSPAGAVESLLPEENWIALVNQNPTLALMEPDVEALLINRVGEARDYFIAPVDVCYQLTGLMRMHWRGLSGGEKVWDEIGSFFARLRENSCMSFAPATEALHA